MLTPTAAWPLPVPSPCATAYTAACLLNSPGCHLVAVRDERTYRCLPRVVVTIRSEEMAQPVKAAS
jgi:hypothetical protein